MVKSRSPTQGTGLLPNENDPIEYERQSAFFFFFFSSFGENIQRCLDYSLGEAIRPTFPRFPGENRVLFSMKSTHPFRKKWGQNFLADPQLLEKIVRVVQPQPSDRVLEIGPGEGSLTELLLPRVGHLAVIEIDPLLVRRLQEREGFRRVRVIHGDVLLLDLADTGLDPPLRVVGNIPYNITTPILFWLLDQRPAWRDAFLMMQKEVAERLTAAVGSKAYGRLSVMLQTVLEVKTEFLIPPDVFYPRPRVESALVRLAPRQDVSLSPAQWQRLEKITAAAFSQRRKMLRNSLKGFGFPRQIQDRIDFTRRPETLTLEEFLLLSDPNLI
ncbi:MAG: 16S rRNA (adenine(1518)-N(6)/adenine(1519)-N(6))-dimethyltransferase RsmA [Candidatus Neomarinimicrobiota bacterium]|nr:MAG: 16S rRNA (adenine(1518)-N(6)/adenine(1519)-N(6))-dimethyltransferase RsmA [Candidatus Neomarinimicrobiota bacterium]